MAGYADKSHTTQLEVDFINGLGSYFPGTTMTRKKLLKAYLKSLDKRVAWGRIDQTVVRAHVVRELSKK